MLSKEEEAQINRNRANREIEDLAAGKRVIPTLPDSGARTSFGEGRAIREADPHKPAMEGISPFMLERLGVLLARGAQKYGDFRNWERGMPFTRCIGAILRHTARYMLRRRDEDHLAAIVWNAMVLIHYEEVGFGPELDDRPHYGREDG